MSQLKILYFMTLTVSTKIPFYDGRALSISKQNMWIHMVKQWRAKCRKFFCNLSVDYFISYWYNNHILDHSLTQYQVICLKKTYDANSEVPCRIWEKATKTLLRFVGSWFTISHCNLMWKLLLQCGDDCYTLKNDLDWILSS